MRRRRDYLFWFLLAASLVPLWSFRFVPTQDGPNHLYSAGVLLHYRDSPLYPRFYEINAQPNPNWLSHLMLAGLLALFPPHAAEKILLSLYLVLLPLGMRYALRAVRPGAAPLAVLVFPLLYNWAMHCGFYNFILSLAALLFALGYWIRCQDGVSAARGGIARSITIFSALLLLVYFLHLISIGMLVAAVAVLIGWLAFYESRILRRPAWAAAKRRLAFTIPAAAVFCALGAVFVGRERAAAGAAGVAGLYQMSFARLLSLFTLDTFMISYRIEEFPLALLLAILLLTLAGFLFARRVRRRRWKRWDGLILVVLAWMGLYTAAPSTLGDAAYIYPRMAVYFYLALILWLGSGGLSRQAVRRARLAAGGLALAFFLFHGKLYAEAQVRLREFDSVAPAITPGTVMLSICLSPFGLISEGEPWSVSVEPFRHAADWVALERGCVNLGDAEGSTTHSPTRFRAALNPKLHLGRLSTLEEIAALDLQRYEKETGVRLDAVLVWDDRRAWMGDPNMERLRGQVERMFPEVFNSRGHRFVWVYRR